MVQTPPIRESFTLSVAVQGQPPARPGEGPSANHRVISPGYFKALGIPVVRGRVFNQHDTEKSPMVAVVDQAFVDRHFPNENPIGRGIGIGNGSDGFYRIVGVVGDVHYSGLDTTPAPSMYVPYKQDPYSGMWLVVRTIGDPAQYASLVRQSVREIDGSLPAYSIMPLEEIVSESIAQRRFPMLLLVLFALVALFLAAVGLYGVVAYAVSQRTQEIGVRMAVGASRGDVLRMVLVDGMKLALVGVALGLGAAIALAGYLASLLFSVTPFDPASYLVTAAILLAVAAFACYVPARRAMSVDPLVALRAE